MLCTRLERLPRTLGPCFQSLIFTLQLGHLDTWGPFTKRGGRRGEEREGEGGGGGGGGGKGRERERRKKGGNMAMTMVITCDNICKSEQLVSIHNRLIDIRLIYL